MSSEKIILMSISSDQLENLIRDAVRSELSKQKEKELMNFREVCAFLKIHPSTLNKWKREGKIPFKKLGKRIFFNQKDILDALEDSNYSKLKKLRSEK